jgi:hypothetical protein
MPDAENDAPSPAFDDDDEVEEELFDDEDEPGEGDEDSKNG